MRKPLCATAIYVGGALAITTGFVLGIWTINIIADSLGFIGVLVSMVGLPITLVASVPIVWTGTGEFPFLLLLLWLLMWLGIITAAVGGFLSRN